MRMLVRRVWVGEILKRQNQQDLATEWKWEGEKLGKTPKSHVTRF